MPPWTAGQARVAGELRQPVQGQVDLDGAAAGLPAPDVGHEVSGQHRRVEQPQERDLRVRGGDDRGRVDSSPLASVTPATRPSGSGSRPPPPRCGSRRRTTGPPAASAAVTRPSRRVGTPTRRPARPRRRCGGGHHVRGARPTRPGPGADHAGHREQAEHGVALEVLLDEVGDAAGEQPGDVDDAPLVQPAQVAQQQSLPPQIQRPLIRAGAAPHPASGRAPGRGPPGGPRTGGRRPRPRENLAISACRWAGSSGSRRYGRRPGARSRGPAGTRGSRAGSGSGR